LVASRCCEGGISIHAAQISVDGNRTASGRPAEAELAGKIRPLDSAGLKRGRKAPINKKLKLIKTTYLFFIFTNLYFCHKSKINSFFN